MIGKPRGGDGTGSMRSERIDRVRFCCLNSRLQEYAVGPVSESPIGKLKEGSGRTPFEVAKSEGKAGTLYLLGERMDKNQRILSDGI